ncbi:MAG: hydantoinase/oxoprolinase family protein [Gammaproteobacteria bacterium]|nr:hydantoinase/oxoprolinase family protein [Gammaproteobacteria bacterium]
MTKPSDPKRYRVGIDVGGTFTDFCLIDTASGTLTCHKTPSTPRAPEQAILDGLAVLLESAGAAPTQIGFLGHGTTVATNLLIERRGARTALITTRGFRDVLEIARQTRPHLYDYSRRRPTPLVPRHLRLELDERVDARGDILRPLDLQELQELGRQLHALDVEAVAVCLLNGYRNPAHEQRVCEHLRNALGAVFVSASHQVLPEFREFERTATTVANAYVGPTMRRYIGALAAGLRELGIAVAPYTFHSNGGILSERLACDLPVRTCLSGPAAGVVGAADLGRTLHEPDVVAFDVGGTSTDVSLIAGGRPELRGEREVAGFPIKSPSLDVHVIGAGGGSIAWVDGGGALRVGPRSAGAWPGPVAYDQGGTEPTVTDANLVLGRLSPAGLLAGRLPLNVERARQAIHERLARPLGLDTQHAAEGIIQIAVANIARAIRAVSTERGHQLSRFTLMAYGGAGPVLAAAVARETGCTRVVIPADPGAMCARGVLVADMSIDLVRTRLCALVDSEAATLRTLFAELQDEAGQWFDSEAVPARARRVELRLDARYLGQGFEIAVPVAEGFAEQAIGGLPIPDLRTLQGRFRDAHRQHYGYALDDRAVEVVNLRLKAMAMVGSASRADPAAASTGLARAATRADADTRHLRPVYFREHGEIEVEVVSRDSLQPGSTRHGPLIVEELTSTLVVFPGDRLDVDQHGNLLMSVAP